MSDGGLLHGFEFDLGDLTPDQRVRLDQVLVSEGIERTWRGTTLAVDFAYEPRVTTLVSWIRTQSGPAAPPGTPGSVPTTPNVASPTTAPVPPSIATAPSAVPAGPAGGTPVTPYGYGYGYVTPAPAPKTNSMAIVSLVCGIGSLVVCPLTGPIAVYTGVRGRREIRTSNGAEQGDGLALAGLITGAVGTALVVGSLLFFLVVIVLGFSSSSS